VFSQLVKHDRSFTFLVTHHTPNKELPKFFADYYSSQPRKTRVFQLAKHDRSVNFLDRYRDDDCLIYGEPGIEFLEGMAAFSNGATNH